jgi:hypothetical protein
VLEGGYWRGLVGVMEEGYSGGWKMVTRGDRRGLLRVMEEGY